MTVYRALEYLPPLVQQAQDFAAGLGFTQSSIPEVGRLLGALAGAVQSGVIGEIGTGTGAGLAWAVTYRRPGVAIVSVERDRVRAAAAADLFRAEPQVRILEGDWHGILPHGPFRLLLADGGNAKAQEPEMLLQVLEVGGTILLDDLTPKEQWPEEWRGQRDRVREFWLNEDRLAATEILVTPNSAVILATRIA